MWHIQSYFLVSHYVLLARDAQAKLALIVAQRLSVHPSVCRNVALCEHGLNELIAGIPCNFFFKLVEGAYVHSIARREPRRLPACFITIRADWGGGMSACCIAGSIVMPHLLWNSLPQTVISDLTQTVATGTFYYKKALICSVRSCLPAVTRDFFTFVILRC